MAADQYASFADSYDRENASNLLNEWYERPAMIALAGQVRGRRILDAGCGSGPLSAALSARGAIMAGFDRSPAMVELARQRLGDQVPILVADLAAPLPFSGGAFDDVVASLVLHYLKDWTGPLAELRRVLKPGGRLSLSVNHPTVRRITHPDQDYFTTNQYVEDFEFAGEKAALTMWHRPLHALMNAFTEAGFAIKVVAEPDPSSDTPEELLPPLIQSGERTAFLCFIFFVLEKEPTDASATAG